MVFSLKDTGNGIPTGGFSATVRHKDAFSALGVLGLLLENLICSVSWWVSKRQEGLEKLLLAYQVKVV